MQSGLTAACQDHEVPFDEKKGSVKCESVQDVYEWPGAVEKFPAKHTSARDRQKEASQEDIISSGGHMWYTRSSSTSLDEGLRLKKRLKEGDTLKVKRRD
jgi:hypothetical protein